MRILAAHTQSLTQSYRRGAGFSLIELMIAMTLGLILIAGMTSVVVNSSRSHAELDKSSRQVENGRYAIQALREDIRHAGYYGEFTRPVAPAAMPAACATTLADLRDGMGIPVQGFAGAAATPVPCLPGYVANTDILVIRRASTSIIDAADLDATDIYLQSSMGSMVLDTGADPTVFNLTKRDGFTAGDIRKYLVLIYYIRGCSICDGDGDGIPTLSRAEFVGGNFNSVLPIAEGIENIQLRYGIDDSLNGAPDRFEILPTNVTDWSNVVTVEANLLARNVEQTPGYEDNKSYTLGNVEVGAANDAFKRHVFTAMTRVVNPSSRREN